MSDCLSDSHEELVTEVVEKMDNATASKKRKKPPEAETPKKRTGYIIYSKDHREEVAQRMETELGHKPTFQDVSKELGRMWKLETLDVQEPYKKRAAAERAQLKLLEQSEDKPKPAKASDSKKPKPSKKPAPEEEEGAVSAVAHIARYPSAYECFKEQVRAEVTDNHCDDDPKQITRVINRLWLDLPPRERLIYERQHQALYQCYMANLLRNTPACVESGESTQDK